MNSKWFISAKLLEYGIVYNDLDQAISFKFRNQFPIFKN